MENHFEDYIQQAFDQVEAWDLPLDQFAQAVNDQARLMAGINLEVSDTNLAVRFHTALRF